MNISNSKAKTFHRCRKAYSYKYEWGLRPVLKSRPLEFGIWMHELLEAHYAGEDWREVHRHNTKQFKQLSDESKDEIGDLPKECGRKMLAYLYHYREADEDYEVIHTEIEFEVPMPHGHTFNGKIDCITVDEYGVWVWERKTHDRLPNAMDRFKDSQTVRYAWAMMKIPEVRTLIEENGGLAGVVWDYIIRKPATKPKLNKPTKAHPKGELSKRKINTDLITFMAALKEYGLDPRNYRDTIESLKADNQFFTRIKAPLHDQVALTLVKDLIYTADEIEGGKWKPIRNIGFNCNNCEFQRLCVTELYGGDVDGVIDAAYVKSERRKGVK